MPHSTNKLVDKYQYRESQIVVDGMAQLITAKHIILKQYYTLKKINISNLKTLPRYHGVINEMNILKNIGSSVNVIKCHKMLKTSNNLYVVYDLIGIHPTLSSFISQRPNLEKQKKKSICLQIINVLKILKSKKIILLNLSPKIIQIDQNYKVKFFNLQGALFSTQNISSYFFQNIEISQNTPQQLKEFIQSCQTSIQKQINFNLLSQQLDKTDIYLLGKTFQKIYQSQLSSQKSKKTLFQTQQIQNENNFNSFELQLKVLIDKITEINPKERPSLQTIQQFFFSRNVQEKKPKIKISRLKSKSRQNDNFNDIQHTQSVSNLCKNNLYLTRQFLSPNQDDQFDKKSVKSIKSSGDYTDTVSSPSKIKKRKVSFSNIQSENSAQDHFKTLVLRVIKRRNLCRFLLKISKIIFSLQLIDINIRIMLSFLLIKKSVLLMCSLARYISTGKGQTDQFDFKDSVRKQFSKTNDFFKLSVSINKQMESARNLYQTCMRKIKEQFSEIIEEKEYSFDYECKSQNLNQKLLKHLIRKLINQLLRRINSTSKGSENIRKSNQKLLCPEVNQRSFLVSSIRSYKQSKLLEVDDITVSVKSARTLKSNASYSSLGDGNNLIYQNDIIVRNVQFQSLMNLYLMMLILDFQTYEKMFQNLIIDEQIVFQQQSLVKTLKKMQPKEIATKMHEMIH